MCVFYGDKLLVCGCTLYTFAARESEHVCVRCQSFCYAFLDQIQGEKGYVSRFSCNGFSARFCDNPRFVVTRTGCDLRR